MYFFVHCGTFALVSYYLPHSPSFCVIWLLFLLYPHFLKNSCNSSSGAKVRHGKTGLLLFDEYLEVSEPAVIF